MSQGILAGKTGVVIGVANKRSIAWGIAQAWSAAGANLIFNYQSERLKGNVEELASTLPGTLGIAPCDVASDLSIEEFFNSVRGFTPSVEMLLHSVAYAPREALEGKFIDTSREAFTIAHDISAFSLVALSRAVAPLMTQGGSITALSFLGSQRVVPNYNVMGVAKAALEAAGRYLAVDLGPHQIRVNCISAGPMQTLAARGIADFPEMLRHFQEHSPIGRSCTLEELGATATFLASEGGAAITGQVLYVDGGYQIVAM